MAKKKTKRSYYYIELIAIIILMAVSFGLIFIGVYGINQALYFQQQCETTVVQILSFLGLGINCGDVPNFLTMAEVMLIVGIIILAADVYEINRFNKIMKKKR
ncbi:hypothetical protein GF352_03970 [archaeon]|nr:hypothetical protein [archaeon]